MKTFDSEVLTPAEAQELRGLKVMIANLQDQQTKGLVLDEGAKVQLASALARQTELTGKVAPEVTIPASYHWNPYTKRWIELPEITYRELEVSLEATNKQIAWTVGKKADARLQAIRQGILDDMAKIKRGEKVYAPPPPDTQLKTMPPAWGKTTEELKLVIPKAEISNPGSTTKETKSVERLVGKGETLNNLLPMPPTDGPPLPRMLALRWPWKK